jgi:hypothetical protein
MRKNEAPFSKRKQMLEIRRGDQRSVSEKAARARRVKSAPAFADDAPAL